MINQNHQCPSNSDPLVSIIVTCYNHEFFISDCIESILNQTYSKIELIVFDDASTDSSALILEKMAEVRGFNFIRHEENKGLLSTLNEGLSLFSGDYLILFSGDDVMLPNRVQKQIDFLETNLDYYACSGGQRKIDEFGILLPRFKQRNLIKKFVQIDKTNFFKKTNQIFSPTTMYRRQERILLGNYKPDIKLEDLYIFYKAASKNMKMALLPDVYTLYRIHNNNTHTNLVWMHECKLKILEEHVGETYYKKLRSLIYLEGFYSLAGNDKRYALKLLPYALMKLNSLHFFAGLVKLILKWK